jgi:hypothetical protein
MYNQYLHGIMHMAPAKTRAPAGARRIVSACFAELAAIPDDKHGEVARVAQATIWTTMAARRAKANAAKPRLHHGPHVAIRKPITVRTRSRGGGGVCAPGATLQNLQLAPAES